MGFSQRLQGEQEPQSAVCRMARHYPLSCFTRRSRAEELLPSQDAAISKRERRVLPDLPELPVESVVPVALSCCTRRSRGQGSPRLVRARRLFSPVPELPAKRPGRLTRLWFVYTSRRPTWTPITCSSVSIDLNGGSPGRSASAAHAVLVLAAGCRHGAGEPGAARGAAGHPVGAGQGLELRARRSGRDRPGPCCAWTGTPPCSSCR